MVTKGSLRAMPAGIARNTETSSYGSGGIGQRTIWGCFCISALLGACLSFAVQPMTAKALMPWLGGGPGVWNAAMMFYQTALLVGYGYAHFVSKTLSPRGGAIFHLVFLALALAVLPPLPLRGVTDSAEHEGYEAIQACLALCLSSGLPFMLLSASSPLFQRWASVGEIVSNPYRLYAWSNAGSFLGLAIYPFVMEPFFNEQAQGVVWSTAFAIFAFLTCMLGVCFICKRSSAASLQHKERSIFFSKALGMSTRSKTYDRLLWTLLSFAPCSVMLSATAFITSEIGSHPLLWVVPLAVYMGAFSIAFSAYGDAFKRRCMYAQPLILCVALVSWPLLQFLSVLMLLHVLVVFVCAGVCCARLAEEKPEEGRLTEFYFCLAIGGALGGVFNSLVAPAVFAEPIEYEISVGLALLLRGGAFSGGAKQKVLDALFPIALFCGILGLATFVRSLPVKEAESTAALLGTLSGFSLLIPLVRQRTGLLFGAAAASRLLLIFVDLGASDAQLLFHERNFFGISRVFRQPDGAVHWLKHGTTIHGMQPQLSENKLSSNVSYYNMASKVIRELPPEIANAPVAVTGLGVGTLACAVHKGQKIDFYEIDPIVIRIAQNPKYFTYLQDCGADVKVILGDARMKLEKAPDHTYGVLVADAYNSDALPMHLLTAEAVALYKRKLKPEGKMLFNISNRHMDLTLPLAKIIADMGWVGRKMSYKVEEEKEEDTEFITNSEWIVAAPSEALLGEVVTSDPKWKPLPDVTNEPLWTDSHSSVLRVLMAK